MMMNDANEDFYHAVVREVNRLTDCLPFFFHHLRLVDLQVIQPVVDARKSLYEDFQQGIPGLTAYSPRDVAWLIYLFVEAAYGMSQSSEMDLPQAVLLAALDAEDLRRQIDAPPPGQN